MPLHVKRSGHLSLVGRVGVVVEVTGGEGLVVDINGALDWVAVMPVNGLDFELALRSARTW